MSTLDEISLCRRANRRYWNRRLTFTIQFYRQYIRSGRFSLAQVFRDRIADLTQARREYRYFLGQR